MGDRSNLTSGVREGDVLSGKYRIDQVLGVGGMGVVVAARHLQLDERVAIKFLLPEALENPEIARRFAREARAVVKIKSECVARVLDVGTLETGAPYMVMEYLEGCDLDSWLERSGPLAIEQAAEFLLHASEAIAEAHALGIVHRDLKPANLFVVRRADGVLAVKVLDFGISKVSGPSGSSGAGGGLTMSSSLLGSPLYMSPEHLQDAGSVDGRSDIWALGVILYELLGGRSPFSAESLPEVCVRILNAVPPPLRSLRPDVPPELEHVIHKCLCKDRGQRYGNVAEFSMALAPFAPERAQSSVGRIVRTIRSAGLEVNEPLAVAKVTSSEAESTRRASRAEPIGPTARGSAPRLARYVVVGLAVCSVLGATWWWGFHRAPHAREDAAVARSSASTAEEFSAASADRPTLAAAPSHSAIEPAKLAVAPGPTALPSAKPSAVGPRDSSALVGSGARLPSPSKVVVSDRRAPLPVPRPAPTPVDLFSQPK